MHRELNVSDSIVYFISILLANCAQTVAFVL